MILKHDFCQLSETCFNFNFLPKKCVATVVNITMLMELKGIKIAATTGAKFPVTAKPNPITL